MRCAVCALAALATWGWAVTAAVAGNPRARGRLPARMPRILSDRLRRGGLEAVRQLLQRNQLKTVVFLRPGSHVPSHPCRWRARRRAVAGGRGSLGYRQPGAAGRVVAPHAPEGTSRHPGPEAGPPREAWPRATAERAAMIAPLGLFAPWAHPSRLWPLRFYLD